MHPAGCYRIFDCGVLSQVQLAGLPAWTGEKAELEIRACNAVLDLSGFVLVHEWKENSGEVASACFRRSNEYLLRFPAYGDFLLQPDPGHVMVYTQEGIGPDTLAHLLMDQVLPRMLFQRGRMVAHASAVQLVDGRAVVFVGKSGMGKSSLAAYCSQAGLRMMADDTVILELGQSMGPGAVRVIPAYTSLRLWPDMMAALFPESSEFESVAQYTTKVQRFEPAGHHALHTSSYDLAALVLLGDPAYSGPVRLKPMSGRDAAVSLLEALFTLDVYNGAMLARNLAWVGQVTNSGIPVLQLDYARSPSEWPLVLDAVLDATMDVAGEGQPA